MRLLPIGVDPAAKFEVANAAAAYEATRPGLADRFLDDFEAIRRKLEQFPESCQEFHPGLRKALFHRFPYGAVYQVKSDSIQILAVFPTMTDPVMLAERVEERMK